MTRDLVHEPLMPSVAQCYDCKHFHVDDTTCDAFPVKIPIDIKRNIFDHHLPYEGDNGIQFEPWDNETDHEEFLKKSLEYFLKKKGITHEKLQALIHRT